MAWYNTGSINLTNGSPTVTGVGTDFVSNVLAGQGLTTQDGRLYEIAAVVSATSLTLRTPYYGGTAGAAAYAILPTQSLIKDLADSAAALIGSFASVRDGIGAGLLQDGTVGIPALRFAADQDTGFRRVGNNMLSMVTSGVDRVFVGANGIGVGSAPDGRSGLLVQGVDQQTAALVDGGAHGGSIMLRANGVGAGDGGAVLFATTFTNGTPFAAIKGLVSDGSGGTVGDLAFAVRGAVTDGTLTERMRLSTKGYLGLGCAPLYQFHVQGAGQQATDLTDAGAKGGSLYLQDSSNGGLGAGGALLFGVTNGYGTPFASIKGSLQDAANGTKGNLVFGTRGATNATSIVARWILFGDGGFAPAADNAYDIGNGALRARTLYSATGAINTSDERMKQQIGDIPDDWLDAWGAVRHVRYKFNDAVAEKGDAARWHLGFVAQEIKAAFDAKGIDALRIGLLCHDVWGEETEAETEEVTRIERTPRFTPSATLVDGAGAPLGTWSYDEKPITETVPTGKTIVTREAGHRWSLRYDECQAIESAWLRRELLGLRSSVTTLQAAA